MAEHPATPRHVGFMSASRFSFAHPRAYLLSTAAGFATFVAVYVIDRVLARIGLHAEATILDDLLLGGLVAALVMSLELQHQSELRAQEEKLFVALEMNHHIRNALQTIVYLNFQNPDKEAAEKVSAAAKRIEWALREVLPGEDRRATGDERRVAETSGTREEKREEK